MSFIPSEKTNCHINMAVLLQAHCTLYFGLSLLLWRWRFNWNMRKRKNEMFVKARETPKLDGRKQRAKWNENYKSSKLQSRTFFSPREQVDNAINATASWMLHSDWCSRTESFINFYVFIRASNRKLYLILLQNEWFLSLLASKHWTMIEY